jgi:uncharacterized protein (DUF1778 family)
MSTTVSVYLPDEADRRLVRQAAKLAGKPTAAFMREALLETSKKLIEKHGKKCLHCGAVRHERAA